MKIRSVSNAKIVLILRHKVEILERAIAAMQRVSQIMQGRYAATTQKPQS